MTSGVHLDGVSWTRHLESAPWTPRQYHDVAVFDGQMWVCEGFNEVGRNRNDVWHSNDGVHWTELPNTPWAPRHAASLFVHDNAMWMVAGNNMEPDVWKLVGKINREHGSSSQDSTQSLSREIKG